MAESNEGRAETADSAPRAEYPRPFGHYLLLQRIARGGMGEVFLAKHGGIAGIEKHCVVKTLRPHYTADREYVTRFIDEARVVVQLAHRNIAQIFDVGRVAKQYYLAMEFITGRDLRSITDRMREADLRFSPNLALHIVGEVLEALDYAHRHVDPGTGRPLHLVHRDVSPQNVMVSFEGEVKLIDFGLAHSTMKVEQTQPNVVMGKMAYMSPEQARGDDVDGRADLFSGAVLCYELLVGERFYEGMGFDQIWSIAGAGGYRPRKWDQLPEGLARALSPALEASRGDRYAACADLKEALVEYQMSAGIRPVGRELRQFMGELFGSESLAHRELIARFKNVSALPSGPHALAPPPDEDSQSFAVSNVESFLDQAPQPSRQSEVLPLHLADRTRVDAADDAADATELQAPGALVSQDTAVSTDADASAIPEMPTLLHSASGSDPAGPADDRTRVEAPSESTLFVRDVTGTTASALKRPERRGPRLAAALLGGVVSAALVAGLVALAVWAPTTADVEAGTGAAGGATGSERALVDDAPAPDPERSPRAGADPSSAPAAVADPAELADAPAKPPDEGVPDEASSSPGPSAPDEGRPPSELTDDDVDATEDAEAVDDAEAIASPREDDDHQRLKRGRRTTKKKSSSVRVEKRSPRKSPTKDATAARVEGAKAWLTPAQKKQVFGGPNDAITFLRKHCLGKVACATSYDVPAFRKKMGPDTSVQETSVYLDGAAKCARSCQRESP